MEFNRNHLFAIGTVLVLLGIQFRYVQSVQLNEKSSRFIVERIEKRKAANAKPLTAILTDPGSVSRKTIQPPQWLGWALISVGAVSILHSFAMKKPG